MQNELDGEGLPASVQIAGVNEAGREFGNAEICRGRNLPWLQESHTHSVWGEWNVAYRDVIILNADNEPVTIYNLTDHTLDDPRNYDTLKGLLRQAAEAASR
jgi:hypothetical protein